MTLQLTSVSLSGSLSEGGWTAQAAGFDLGQTIQPYAEFRLRAKENRNGVWDSGWQDWFKGFITEEAVKRNWQTGEVSFGAATSHWHLQNGWMFGTAFSEIAGTDGTHFVSPLTYAYVIRHLLEKHCNITEVAALDIEATGHHFSDLGLDDAKFWQVIQDAARDEMRLAYFDCFNTFHYVSHPGLTVPTPPARLRFTTEMYHSVDVTEYPPRCAWVRLSAIGDKADILIASYPATGPDASGEQITQDNVRVNDQATLDSLAQRLYTWSNRTYAVSLKTWLNRYVDLGDVIGLDLVDAAQGYNWSNKLFLVMGVDHTLDLERNGWETTLAAEEIP